MFKFIPKDTYKTKVQIHIPGDFGKSEKCEFTVEFRRLQHEEAKSVLKRIGDFARDANTTVDLDAELLTQNLVGWSDVPAEEGGTVPFSSEALAEMLKHQCYRFGLTRIFLDGLRNFQEVARKN